MVVAVGAAVWMAMPVTALTVSAKNACAVQHKRETVDAFLHVGVDLNKALAVNVKTQFQRVVSLVNGFDRLNEGPLGCYLARLALEVVDGHALPSSSVNCRSVLRIPSTAKSQSW